MADSPDDEGAQIDLLIDRNDGIVNICEMKFCDGEYAVTAVNAVANIVLDVKPQPMMVIIR